MPIRTIAVAALAALFALSVVPGAAAAPAKPAGSLDQLAGRNGCLYDPRGGSERGVRVNLPGRCGEASALDGAYEVATSPDGRHVYVASFTGDSLSVFARNATTGRLTQLAGGDGCVVDAPFGVRCGTAPALDGPSGVAVSPDGRHVYVGLYMTHGVAAFSRNRTTGALTPLPGADACVSERVNERECAQGTALFGAGAVVVSPEGRHLYVASFWHDAVAVFARDPATGALRQLEGRDGCIRDPIYVEEGDDGCGAASGIEGPVALALAPDGRTLYVAAFGAGGLGLLQRDPASGRLTGIAAPAGCWSENPRLRGCSEARSVEGAFAVTVSRDGRSVYLASGFDRRDGSTGSPFAASGVSVFSRAANGRVRQLAGKAGCVNETGRQGCTDGRALEGAQSVVVSPDGRNLYLAAAASDAIAIFRRDPANGRIAQLPGRAGCVSDHGTRGACRVGTGLWGVSAIAVAPDGRHAYAPGFYSSAISVFTRAPQARTGR